MLADSPLDVVYVGTLPPHHGGSALMSAQVLEALARRGHAIRAVAPMTALVAAAGDEYARRAPEMNVRRYIVSHFETSPDTPSGEAYQAAEFEQVAVLVDELISARRPDLVIGGRESFAFTMSHLSRRHGLPWLQMVQGSTAIGILRGTYPPARAAPLLERLRAADAVVTPARHLASALEQLGVSPVQVVPNPVDLRRFTPGGPSDDLRARLDIDPAAFVVVHISNLKALKRIQDLVAAAGLLADSLPTAVYVVLGSGPDRRRLQESVAELGLQSRFRFVPWVAHARVREFIALADVVVMPSAGEAQALVYLETQACGRTLVASDIPAAREVVEHGRNGLLFPVGDVQALAATIARTAADPALRAEIGRHAAVDVRSHALDATVSGYETLLYDLRARTSTSSRSRKAASDVTAVLLTMGESTTDRALSSVCRQTLQPADIVVVEGVSPFFEALRTGVASARTPFVVQVDSDMVLDETCFERLRAAMITVTELGIAVGQLRDPLIGSIAGIKLFRRECFEHVPLRDSLTPDIDFYFDLADRGWLTQHILSYDGSDRSRLHTFGDHLPELTPEYSYSTYLLLGCRYFNRRDLPGLLWRYGRLRKSGHPMALTCRVALLAGLLHNETRDVPKSSVVVDPSLLDALSARPGVPTSSFEADSSWFSVGAELRREGNDDRFRRLLLGFESLPVEAAWTREAALCHGFCRPGGAESEAASTSRIEALAVTAQSRR